MTQNSVNNVNPAYYANTHGESYAPALRDRMMIEAETDDELPETFVLICSSCHSRTAGPRLKHGDPIMTCNECGADWKVTEVPIVK